MVFPKPVLHFLQQQIVFFRDILESTGIYIPQTATLEWFRKLSGDALADRDPSEENNHLALCWALQQERWPYFPPAIQNFLPKVWSLLLEELAGSTAEYCIITAENFSWDLNKKSQIQAIRGFLAGHDVTIFCCFRPYHDFIASMYGALISLDRGPFSIDEFVSEFYPKWELGFQKGAWSEVFGVSHFRDFSYDSISGTDMLKRFLSVAVPGHASTFRSYPVTPENEPNYSFSARFLRFIEELHANKLSSSNFKKLYRLFPTEYVPLEKRLISNSQIDAALARHEARNCLRIF